MRKAQPVRSRRRCLHRSSLPPTRLIPAQLLSGRCHQHQRSHLQRSRDNSGQGRQADAALSRMASRDALAVELAVNLAGLVLTANGNRVEWVRDQVDMYAFHVNVPKGVTSLEANFQYLAPINPKQGRISSKFANVTWNEHSSLSCRLLLAAHHILNFHPLARGLEVRLRAGNQVAGWQPGRVQRHHVEHADRFAALRRRELTSESMSPLAQTIRSSSICLPTSPPILRPRRNRSSFTRIS